MKTLLEINQVSIEAGQQASANARLGKVLSDGIVKNVSFTLTAQRPLVIVGETGSGKTLLAQAIAGILPASLKVSGEILLNGDNLLTLPPAKRQALWGQTFSILPQEPMQALDPTMRCVNQVREGYRDVQKLSKQAANSHTQEAFAEQSLSDYQRYYPHQLSGGMAQRMALITTHASGGYITIADEPTKGLDSERKQVVINLLKTLMKSPDAASQTPQGLLVITHDIAVAEGLGGDVIILKDGEIVESGASKAVLTKPQHDFTRALLAANPATWPQCVPAPQAKGDTVLKLNQLSAVRGGKTLFSGLNIALKPGDVIGLFGQSGCGKSTLGDLIFGQFKPITGDIKRNHDYINIRYQKLFQDPSDVFAPLVTLKQSFSDLIAKYQLSTDLLDELLTSLNLEDSLLERYPNQVSGGELQRLAIARIMLLKPVFIFADEPTSRLDMLTQKTVIELLLRLAHQHGVALIIVSHERELLDAICQQVIEL